MLVAEGIRKAYKHPVLNGVSLTVGNGEIIGIAGENGSGKSTLLSVLTAVTHPDSGRVTVEDADILRDRHALRNLGYVPQEYSLFENLTVQDNIKLWASLYKTDWKAVLPFLFPQPNSPEKAFLRKKAGQLSGGMKKRLSIAISLLHQPKYLIMDEPSAGLDIAFKWTLAEIIQGLKTEGRTVLFTSHQPDELLWCDRIYVLRDGVFVYNGDPRLLGNTQTPDGSIPSGSWDGGFSEALRHLITGV